MTDSMFSHLLVPIANRDDAERTCAQLVQSIESDIDVITVVFVIETTDGYPDRTSPAAMKREAEWVFSYVEEYFHEGPEIRRELRAGNEPVAQIIAAADELGVSAIGFSPRPKTTLQRILTANHSYRLITESHYPVIAFSKHPQENT